MSHFILRPTRSRRAGPNPAKLEASSGRVSPVKKASVAILACGLQLLPVRKHVSDLDMQDALRFVYRGKIVVHIHANGVPNIPRDFIGDFLSLRALISLHDSASIAMLAWK